MHFPPAAAAELTKAEPCVRCSTVPGVLYGYERDLALLTPYF